MAVVVAVVRRWRQRGYGEGGSSGTERAMAVACRGWADGMGSVSLWAGSMLGL